MKLPEYWIQRIDEDGLRRMIIEIQQDAKKSERDACIACVRSKILPETKTGARAWNNALAYAEAEIYARANKALDPTE